MKTSTKTLIVGTLALAGVVATGGIYAGYVLADNRALPNTFVGASDVSYLRASEIEALLTEAAKNSEVSISGQGVNATHATIRDMGIDVDAAATARDAVAANRDWVSYFTSFFEDAKIDPTLDCNKQELAEFAASLTEGNEKAIVPVNPVPEFQETGFVVKPGMNGTGVDTQHLENSAQELMNIQDDVDLNVTLVPIEPELSEEDVQPIVDAANELIASDVIITAGDAAITPTAADKALWVDFTGEEPAINKDAMAQWVAVQAAPLNVQEVRGYRYVNSAGTVLRTLTAARAGVTVDNVEDVTNSIFDNLTKHQATQASFVLTTGKEEWDQKVLADGAEYLAYPAGVGEKWIDVNLSSKRMTAYSGATVAYGPVDVLPGLNTPYMRSDVGTFKVYHKRELQTMRGSNEDGTRYETKDVPWILYYNGDEAIHGAYWRTPADFAAKVLGSHGCINTPVDQAHWFYDWAPVGTPVVVHY